MGNLIERLTQTELQAMDRYIENNAGGSGSRADVKYILREWENAKSENLSTIFGDKFIVEKQIEYKKPISKLSDEFYDALWNKDNALYGFRRIFDPFLWAHRTELGDDYYRLKDLLDTTMLAKSEYTGDLFSVLSKDGHEIKVQAGCKPVKILGKVIHSYGEYLNEFEEFRLECSRILNQKKLTGTLCMSIHPLDYMTMSDNNSDWSSCMSWRESGCYRQGTVEMMNSPMVVVGYLKSDNNDMDLRLMKWNSKKWRELFIVTPALICGVKGYPYQNEQLVYAGIDMLKEMVKNTLGWKYYDNAEFKNDNYYSIEANDNIYTFRFETNNMYNDFGSCTHYGAVGEAAFTEGKNFINYSGASECMWCGTLDPCLESEEYLVCDDCDGHCCCEYCGDGYDRDDMYEVDGRLLCQYCYENHTMNDPITDEYHYEDDFHRLYLVPDGFTPTEENLHKLEYINIWDGAEDSYNFDNFFSNYNKFNVGWRTYKYVNVSDCTKRGKELFAYEHDLDIDLYVSDLMAAPTAVTTAQPIA